MSDKTGGDHKWVSLLQVKYEPESKAAAEYLAHSPFRIIPDFLRSLPEKDSGRVVGKHVYLINPFLGKVSSNHIYQLYQNQLEWIAAEWEKLCEADSQSFGDINEISPLLVAGAEFGMFIVLANGEIISTKR